MAEAPFDRLEGAQPLRRSNRAVEAAHASHVQPAAQRSRRWSQSVRDKKIHVIFPDGTFDSLPDDIRKLGPWQSLKRGDLERLKTHYRPQLAEQGFVVVHQSMGTFSPDHA